MAITQNIKQIITAKSPEETIKNIDNELCRLKNDDTQETKKIQAALLAEKGKILWHQQRRAEAISAYETGAILDPDGPAALLLEHSRSIMDFFCADLLNP